MPLCEKCQREIREDNLTTILLEKENVKKLLEDIIKRIDRLTTEQPLPLPYERFRSLHREFRGATV